MLLDPQTIDDYADNLQTALDEERWDDAAGMSEHMSSTRLADLLKESPPEGMLAFLDAMERPRAGRVLGQLPPPLAARVFEGANESLARRLFPAIPADRGSDILREMEEEDRARLLETLSSLRKGQMEVLLGYPGGTAGGAMNPHYLAVRPGNTIEQTQRAVLAAPAAVERVSYVYVTNARDQPIGVISIKDLYRFRPSSRVEEAMNPDVIVVRADEEASRAAHIIRNRRFTHLPVVDDAGRILGVITFDDAMDLIAEEVAERFSGPGSREESFYTSPRDAVRMRLPWMAANVMLNLGAVAVIAGFEDTIAQVAILAAFLPMITDMGGNVGIQSLSVAIRSIALGEARLRDFWLAVRKEVLVGLTNGLVLGVQFALIAWWLEGNPWLGALAGLALAINVLLAGVVGGSLPFLIKRLGKDPAMMTGPVLTTITDITGVTIYLGLCTVFLTQLL